MGNQQETKSLSQLNIKRVGSSETTQEGSFIEQLKVKERLRYSPTNIKNNNLSLNSLKSLFMNKLLKVRKINLQNLSIHHHHFSTISRHLVANNDKIILIG